MTLNQIIQRHYRMTRPVTDSEVKAEITSLQRKEAKGNLDDNAEHLYYALGVENMSVDSVQGQVKGFAL